MELEQIKEVYVLGLWESFSIHFRICRRNLLFIGFL